MKHSAMMMLMMMLFSGGIGYDPQEHEEINKLIERFKDVVPVDKQQYWYGRVKSTKTYGKKKEMLKKCIRYWEGR